MSIIRIAAPAALAFVLVLGASGCEKHGASIDSAATGWGGVDAPGPSTTPAPTPPAARPRPTPADPATDHDPATRSPAAGVDPTSPAVSDLALTHVPVPAPPVGGDRDPLHAPGVRPAAVAGPAPATDGAAPAHGSAHGTAHGHAHVPAHGHTHGQATGDHRPTPGDSASHDAPASDGDSVSDSDSALDGDTALDGDWAPNGDWASDGDTATDSDATWTMDPMPDGDPITDFDPMTGHGFAARPDRWTDDSALLNDDSDLLKDDSDLQNDHPHPLDCADFEGDLSDEDWISNCSRCF